jgi:hypothetical protein
MHSGAESQLKSMHATLLGGYAWDDNHQLAVGYICSASQPCLIHLSTFSARFGIAQPTTWFN